MDKDKTPQSLRILLVEDNEHDALAFQRIFRKDQVSYEITHYMWAEEALEYLRGNTGSLDVVVSDNTFDTLTAVHVANALAHEMHPTGWGAVATINHAYLAELGLTERLSVWRKICQETIPGITRIGVNLYAKK